MELKDLITILVSFTALLASLLALYFSHFYNPSNAVLTFCSRYFDVMTKERGVTRELTYTLSNTGKQGLYLKDISILLGKSPLGPLIDKSTYLVIVSDPVESSVLASGEIRELKLIHDLNYDIPKEYQEIKTKFIIVHLELVSADGNRYVISHDITNLGPDGPELSDPIWDGVVLKKIHNKSNHQTN